MIAQEWTVNGLSVELGVDRRTIAKRLAKVKPVRVDGKSSYYLMKPAALAILNPGDGEMGNLEQEKTRLTKWQADEKELDVADKRAELIPSDLVIATWQVMIASMRAKVLSLPSKIAAVALAAKALREIEVAARELIHEALEELSNDGLPDDYRKRLEKNREGVEAATVADGEPVGGRKAKAKPGGKRRARTMAD